VFESLEARSLTASRLHKKRTEIQTRVAKEGKEDKKNFAKIVQR
jgi:hypothetical protein